MGANAQDPEVSTNIYDKVHTERCGKHGSLYATLHIPMAYLVCAYVLLEGLFIILWEKPSLGLHGPFSQSETVFLYAVAWGDVVCAFVGAIGIWFSHNLLPLGWRNTSRMHQTYAKVGSGILLAWRTLVCFSIAPWAGIALAFSSPHTDKVWMYLLVCGYFILSIFLVYILMMTFRQIITDSIHFQEHLDGQAMQERIQLLNNAAQRGNWADCNEGGRDVELEPVLFCFFDLAPTVMLYAFVLTIASAWSFFHLILSGHTAGGWAFFSSTPQVSTTFWFEAILYPICFAGAVIGMAAAASLSESSFVLDENQSRSSLLLFFLSCVFRFGLLFAVTGMCLLEKNTCGFYLHGLASIAYRSPFGGAAGISLHCVGTEWLFLGGVLLAFILDGYLTWATYKLYHHCHAWKLERPSEVADHRL